MNTNTSIQRIIPIGHSGIYVDPPKIIENLQKWNEETPVYMKKQQLDQLACVLLIIAGGIIIFSSIQK